MFVTSDTKIEIMNPLNPSLMAAYFSCESNITLEVSLKEDFTLIAKPTDLNFEITDFKALFLTPETLTDIKQKVKGIKMLLMNALSDSLQVGQKMPIPDTLKRSLKSYNLTTFDHYFLVEADLDIPEAKNVLSEHIKTNIL